jgi:hypothetical protein
MKKRFTLLFLLIGSLLASAQQPAKKDTFDITKAAIQFPNYKKVWGFQVSAGLSMVRPPKDLLENAIQAPLADFHATFGFPYHLSLEAELFTLIVSNQISLGPKYTFMYKNFGAKVGWDVAYMYGQLKQGGFNNVQWAWFHYPNLSVGYKLKKISFTLKGELMIVAKSVSKADQEEVTHSSNFLNGGTVGLYIEQRIHKNKVFVIGIKDNYQKFYWPTWMLYSTFNRYYHIPELNFSWVIK